MGAESLLFSFFLIFTGATVLSTLALFLRVPLLVAYIVVGILLGLTLAASRWLLIPALCRLD